MNAMCLSPAMRCCTSASNYVKGGVLMGGILFESERGYDLGTEVQFSIQIQQDDPLILIGADVRVETLGPDSCDTGMVMSFRDKG